MKGTNMIIYLDVDGTIANWVEGVHKATGIDPGVWDTVGHGLLPTEHQSKIDDAMSFEDFWLGLKPYPWASRLVRELKEHGEVVFCTQPYNAAKSYSGKYQWLTEHFGRNFDVIMMKHKWRLANCHSLLIDDNAESVRRFQAHGGHSILFPQPWNSGSLFQDTPEAREESIRDIVAGARNVKNITTWFQR